MDISIRDDRGDLHSLSLGRETFKTASTPSDYTLSKVIELFLLSREVSGKSDRTLEYYKYYFQKFVKTYPDLADKPFAEITDIQIMRFQKGIVKPHPRLAAWKCFRALYNFAWNKDIIKDNWYCKRIDKPSIPKRTQFPIVEKDQLKALLNVCDKKSFLGLRDYCIIMLLYDTGIRRGELVGLRLEDLDLRNMEITVTGKGNKTRTCSFDPLVRDSLMRYLQHHPMKYPNLFLSEEKKPLGGDGIRQMIRKRATMAGIKGRIYPHLFRHSAVTNMLKSGMDVKMTSLYAGHSNIGVTMEYAKSISSQDASVQHRKYSPVANLDK